MSITLDEVDIHHPDRYAAEGFPWQDWDLLRNEAPVFYYDRDDIEPFWAVTRYDDVMTISNHPEVFINGGPRLRLTLKGEPEILREGLDEFGQSRGWDPQEPPDFVFMDDPRHRHSRRASSWAFTQGCMREMAGHIEELANTFADEFEAALLKAKDRGESVDCVHEYAAKLPLAAIGEIMSLPGDDWKKILIWSEALVGEIPEQRRLPGETRQQAVQRNANDFRAYLEQLVHEHRKPGGRSPFIERLVNTEVQGKLMTDQQLISYLLLLIGAGNDTTRNATAGGIAALIEHPDQLDLLVQNPDLLPTAVDEILRWTSPVISFLRTVTEDFDLSGTKLKAGDTVCMFYPSANRDERQFPDPYRFDITRTPNEHVSFGFGRHFCLGTNLARTELKAAIKSVVPLLPRVEISGECTRIPHTHVSGYSTLPLQLKA